MISILCPTKGRPGRVAGMLHTATETCTEPFGAAFYLDPADPDSWTELLAWQDHPRIARLDMTIGNSLMSDMWNHCARQALRANPTWPLLFVDDEAHFHTPGWDRLICAALGRYRDGLALVHPNDTIHGDLAAGYFAVGPRWVDLFDRLTPPFFSYGYADVWCLEVAQAAGRNIYLPDVVIENLAPKLQPPDQTHLDNQARAERDRPGDLYHATQSIREADVALLRRTIQERAE